MKTIRNTGILALLLLLAFTSCKKENDFGGKATIEGTVTMDGAAVPGAVVYLALDATEKKTDYATSTVTDGSGKYAFHGLLRGNYYVTAEYTNDEGITFMSGGALVEIGDKKGTVDADLSLN